MTDKFKKAHQHLISAKVLMAEVGYDEAGNETDPQAASSARLLARIVAEHKYQFREQILYPYKKPKQSKQPG